jgi:ubiquitin-protein ligase
MQLRQADREEFVFPMHLSGAKAPLFVKIVVPMRFPEAKPLIIICAKVNHASIDVGTKIYSSQNLNAWTTSSKLLPILRMMQAEFEAQPPVAEHLMAKQDSITQPRVSAIVVDEAEKPKVDLEL